MISIEEYDLSFTMFLAEEELFESLTSLGAQAVYESSGIMTIHEGIKESVTKYLGKIAEGVQNVWNKFKEWLEGLSKNEVIVSIKEKINKANPKFVISNCPNYNIDVLDTIKIISFNYEQMKESLKSEQEYVNKYYSSIMKDSSKSFKENIYSAVVTKSQEEKATPDLLKKMYNSLISIIPNKTNNNVKADLNTLNSSTTTIQSMTNQVTSAEEAAYIFESYLIEAENDNKTEFKDEPGAENSNKSTLLKDIAVYEKVNTQIIGAKLKIYKEMAAFYLKTLAHYFKPVSKEKENDTTEQPANNNIQVKVD